MPIEQVYPLSELMAAAREYHAATRKRVTLAWTVLAGINTSRDDARALALVFLRLEQDKLARGRKTASKYSGPAADHSMATS